MSNDFTCSWDENWFSSPAVYDLDGDGKNEIIASRHSVLYVWKSNGTLFWRAPVGENASTSNDHGSSRMYASPVVGDLDNDGLGEIAISYSNKAAVYEHDGNLKAGWPQSFPGSDGEIRSIAAADLDNNGPYEILVVKTSDGPVTCVWNINGQVRTGWPQVDNHDTKKRLRRL
ncbi:MAG: VCBS repeat-containing protein [Chloroflexia bacterium]|nr:VCBS repeat-containing protein [Chloroflexia bacterium]